MRYVRPVLATLAIGCCAVVAGCSPSSDDPATPATSSVAPSADGTGDSGQPPALAPLTDPPADWGVLTLGPVTLDVPDGFVAVAGPEDPTGRISTWVGRHGDQDGARAGISVARDTSPRRDASGTAAAALQAEQAQRGADDAVSGPLPWEGVDAAAHLTYLQDIAIGGSAVQHRAEWVYADLPDGSQITVGVVAPVEIFDELRLHDVLATWRTGP